MRRIALWAVDDRSGEPRALSLETLQSSETEALLEDLLVRSPDLLLPGLTLIGRQVQTEGGPLDLLGVDPDGRVVVFELKRGTLTRDAVAQVLDYASDLASLDADQLARLVEDNSGRGGIQRFEDFADWYRSEYAGAESPLENPPRMVVVGLGADERARRIVDFLAASGIEIQLLTFHGFTAEGQTFLARQVESREPESGNTKKATSKQELIRILNENAVSLQVRPLLEEIVGFIDDELPAYRWPGKWGWTFFLPEQTDAGKPTQRKYVTTYLDPKRPRTVVLSLAPRTVEAVPEAVEVLKRALPETVEPDNWYSALEGDVTAENWPSVKEPLARLLYAVHAAWKRDQSEGAQQEDDPG